MEWKTVLAYITGTVDQELLLRNEYLVAENRILWNQITGRKRTGTPTPFTFAKDWGGLLKFSYRKAA